MPDAEWPPREYGPVIAIPQWAADAVERVLRDLQRPAPVPVQVSWTAGDDWLGLLWIAEITADALSSRMSFGMGRFPPAAMDVELAFQLQEQFFPETEHAWAQARPACPGHSHPAEPAVVDGAAWWTCLRTGKRLWRIGEVPA